MITTGALQRRKSFWPCRVSSGQKRRKDKLEAPRASRRLAQHRPQPPAACLGLLARACSPKPRIIRRPSARQLQRPSAAERGRRRPRRPTVPVQRASEAGTGRPAGTVGRRGGRGGAWPRSSERGRRPSGRESGSCSTAAAAPPSQLIQVQAVAGVLLGMASAWVWQALTLYENQLAALERAETASRSLVLELAANAGQMSDAAGNLASPLPRGPLPEPEPEPETALEPELWASRCPECRRIRGALRLRVQAAEEAWSQAQGGDGNCPQCVHGMCSDCQKDLDGKTHELADAEAAEATFTMCTGCRARQYENPEAMEMEGWLPLFELCDEADWTPNNLPACMVCDQKFGLQRWRHHCRYCGWLVCGNCLAQGKCLVDQWVSSTAGHPNKSSGDRLVLKQVCERCAQLAQIEVASRQALMRRANAESEPKSESELDLEPEPEPEPDEFELTPMRASL
jgi:hypothetical protein